MVLFEHHLLWQQRTLKEITVSAVPMFVDVNCSLLHTCHSYKRIGFCVSHSLEPNTSKQRNAGIYKVGKS